MRKSDLDDIETLNKFITEDNYNDLNQLFAHPKLTTLFERSFISLTILNNNHEIIGAACFDDTIPGLRGLSDDKHYNLWEDWLGKAFNLEGLPITSNNALWLTFVFVADKYLEQV